MIRTANLVTSISRQAGGLHESVRRLTQELNSLEVSVQIITTLDDYTREDLHLWQPLDILALPIAGPRSFSFSKSYASTLKAVSPDLIHAHGIWQYQSVVSKKFSSKFNIPYIISPHGMLDPWALRHHRGIKKIAFKIYEHAHLQSATCLRALCTSEASAFLSLNLKNKIAIIPNGIDLPILKMDPSSVYAKPWQELFVANKKVLLFLSRIHPKKGLLNLIKAWAGVSLRSSPKFNPSSQNWVLCIAGWDQDEHEAELKKMANELNIPWADSRSSSLLENISLLFLGPQFHSDKELCYSACDAFILPSFSEGLPMVVLEAWAYSKPVIMTPECNLPEGFECGASIPITTHTDGIEEGLKILFNSSTADLKEMGEKGRKLVSEKFTWSKVAAEMKRVYEWMLGGGTPPDCIIS